MLGLYRRTAWENIVCSRRRISH